MRPSFLIPFEFLVHFGEISCSSFGIAFATSTLLTHTKGTSCGSIIRQQLASKYRIFLEIYIVHVINPVLMHRTVCILYTYVSTTRMYRCRFLPTLHSASMCFKGWCCASEQVNWRQRLSLRWTNRDELGFCDLQPAYKCIICVHCTVIRSSARLCQNWSIAYEHKSCANACITVLRASIIIWVRALITT